ncbi:MAG: hypothetical protein NC314_01720 [Roseburia sp.]|nr:hypothetical protein [Ruminococcus sp.]MCM1154767.1 hypothetical protein [Roseburia sp.]MCM1241533.1 hypothetical protein [Roseburia sp.]
MDAVEERLKVYGKADLCRPEQSKIEDTIVISKECFYEGAAEKEPYYFAFLHEQAAYIRKRWWVLQFLTLVLTGWSVCVLESGYYLQRALGVSASLFVIMVMPEIWKNRSSQSLEIEGTSYFSLRQIYAARMLLFAVVDGILLLLFAGTICLTKKVDLLEIAIQFFLPMIVTCCICFRTLCSRHMASEQTAYFLVMFWTVIWAWVILDDHIYDMISRPVWIAVICVSLLYLTYVVKQVMRRCGENIEVCGGWE